MDLDLSHHALLLLLCIFTMLYIRSLQRAPLYGERLPIVIFVT